MKRFEEEPEIVIIDDSRDEVQFPGHNERQHRQKIFPASGNFRTVELPGRVTGDTEDSRQSKVKAKRRRIQ